MIQFFRKIRQRLLSENQLIKYLLYAIGEISLDMIGILLTLQVNNWNENKKTSHHEEKLMNELVSALETDINGLKFVIGKNSEIQEQCIFIVDLIEGNL